MLFLLVLVCCIIRFLTALIINDVYDIVRPIFALSLSLIIVTLGDKGSQFHISNSLFAGNQGHSGTIEDFGAALAISVFATLRESGSNLHHNVTNW